MRFHSNPRSCLTGGRRCEARHGWSPRLSLRGATPYAPRDFSKLEGGVSYPEIDQATETYFVTNAGPALTENLPDWRIIRLDR